MDSKAIENLVRQWAPKRGDSKLLLAAVLMAYVHLEREAQEYALYCKRNGTSEGDEKDMQSLPFYPVVRMLRDALETIGIVCTVRVVRGKDNAPGGSHVH